MLTSQKIKAFRETNLEGVRTWASAKDPEAKVGKPFSSDCCPLATCILENHGIKVAVGTLTMSFEDGGLQRMSLTPFQGAFVEKIHTRGRTAHLHVVTAADVLRILDEIEVEGFACQDGQTDD